MDNDPPSLGDILQDALRKKGLSQQPQYYRADAHEDSLYPHLSRDQLERLLYVVTEDNRPSRRIQRGFARAGAVFGSLPVLVGVGTLLNYLLQGWEFTPKDFFASSILVGIAAVAIFAVFAAIGWILSGFFK